ncbi:uncharacterized protein B0H18DRAFT_593712 [Fomitopsis serialis]|uniref:uncharacterized protein n=1 Tax=Fomitopsis serialis TaxID=139415 RepID=UPI0020072D74|nr:uncharacterized protein B0H18DRAFT_593712 [Neoantrodia serialis]KAH9920464.1 hypothetical protein B0H18DRAFT_593712 [Neoantrodia serialis]
MTKTYNSLTPEQVDFFLENGYIVIKQAFTKRKAAEWTKEMWTRLGLDPVDKSTWDRERIHMPWHKREAVSTFAPKAWDAIKDLLGGEERIDEASSSWGDSFIVNLGAPQYEGDVQIDPRDLDNWHVDGDFFVHFLDSPEQALLVIPLYSDIKHRGGATYISPDGIDLVAPYLAAHPEGCLPTGLSFTPSTSTYENPKDHPEHLDFLKEIKDCERFAEMTGEIGDVVLLHPLMLHTASKNHLREARIITNPPVSLKAPFNFNRENPDDFSLVELKTLRALGVDRLDFKPTTERRRVVPRRVLLQQKMLEEEKKRLEALQRADKAVDVSSTAPAIAVA